MRRGHSPAPWLPASAGSADRYRSAVHRSLPEPSPVARAAGPHVHAFAAQVLPGQADKKNPRGSLPSLAPAVSLSIWVNSPFSSLSRPVATDKEPLQDLYIVFVGPQVQEIAPGLLKYAFTLLRLVKKILLITRADQVIARVDPITPSGFRIFGLDHPDRRQLHIHLVIHLDPDHIVLLARYLQRLLITRPRRRVATPSRRISPSPRFHRPISCPSGRHSLSHALSGPIQKIAQQKHDSLIPRAAVEKTDRLAQIRPLPFWLDAQQLPDDIQHMFPSFLWRDIPFDLTAEKDNADLIVVIDRRKRQHRAYFGDQVFLSGVGRAEKRARADIHQEHHG